MAKNTTKPKAQPKAQPVVENEELLVEAEEKKPAVGRVMGCNRLNVRVEASMTSTIITVITEGTEVQINKDASTEDFYKVWTAAGFEGFCLKKFIEVKQ